MVSSSKLFLMCVSIHQPYMIDIVKGLINSINDTEKAVQDIISESLLQIGEEEPLLVLSKGLYFLNNTSKSNKQHRVLVMDVMSQTVDKQEQINKLEIPDDLAQSLVMMSIIEVVAEKVCFVVLFFCCDKFTCIVECR